MSSTVGWKLALMLLCFENTLTDPWAGMESKSLSASCVRILFSFVSDPFDDKLALFWAEVKALWSWRWSCSDGFLSSYFADALSTFNKLRSLLLISRFTALFEFLFSFFLSDLSNACFFTLERRPWAKTRFSLDYAEEKPIGFCVMPRPSYAIAYFMNSIFWRSYSSSFINCINISKFSLWLTL